MHYGWRNQFIFENKTEIGFTVNEKILVRDSYKQMDEKNNDETSLRKIQVFQSKNTIFVDPENIDIKWICVDIL